MKTRTIMAKVTVFVTNQDKKNNLQFKNFDHHHLYKKQEAATERK